MTKIKITWLVIALIALSLPAVLSAQDKTARNIKLRPFYEQGVLLGSYTEPFKVETIDGKSGDISFGYLKFPKLKQSEGIFLIFYPDSELYSRIEDLTAAIMNTKLAIYELDPSSMGTITSYSQVSRLDNFGVNINTDQSRLMTRSFKGTAAFYNFISYTAKDYKDQEDAAVCFIALPYTVFTDNVKFKTFLKEPIESFEIYYGDEKMTFDMPLNSTELLKRLIEVFKSTK